MKRLTLEDVLTSALTYAATLKGAPSAEVIARAAFTRTANAWAKRWRCRFCKLPALPGAALCAKHRVINQAAATRRRAKNKKLRLTSRGTPPKR